MIELNKMILNVQSLLDKNNIDGDMIELSVNTSMSI